MRDVQPATPGSSWILLVLLLHRNGLTLRNVSKRINKLEVHPYTTNSQEWGWETDERMNE